MDFLSVAVHHVLRRWYSGQHNVPPWNQMLIVAQRMAGQSVPNLDLAVKEILLEALDTLDKQSGATPHRPRYFACAFSMAGRLTVWPTV